MLRYVNLWGAGQQIKGEEDANQIWGVVTRGACAIDIDCSKREFYFFRSVMRKLCLILDV